MGPRFERSTSALMVITSFLFDLIPDQRRLADEIDCILCDDDIWINYGPSGPLKALWRFNQTECAAFFDAANDFVSARKFRNSSNP